jgi:hypothetical protein
MSKSKMDKYFVVYSDSEPKIIDETQASSDMCDFVNKHIRKIINLTRILGAKRADMLFEMETNDPGTGVEWLMKQLPTEMQYKDMKG